MPDVARNLQRRTTRAFEMVGFPPQSHPAEVAELKTGYRCAKTYVHMRGGRVRIEISRAR